MTPEGARVAVGEGPIVDAWIDPRTGDLSVISSTKSRSSSSKRHPDMRLGGD
jgi:hypothetical protein